MNKIDQILEILGVNVLDIYSFDQTDALILSRIFDAVKDYAMYNDKDPALEKQCEEFEVRLRKYLNKTPMK